MNGKKRSDKDLLHLGLPPMELAESSVKEPLNNNNGIKRYINPVFPKLVVVIVLVLISVGSYITLFNIIQNLDYRTEIIIVTGIRESPNITIERQNVELLYHLINESSHPVSKREKRHASHSAGDDERDSINHFSDKEIVIAREVIMKHNISCNEENKNQICKDIVTKLREITNHNDHIKDIERADGATSNDMVTFSDTESTNEIKTEHVTSTDETKREIRATTLGMMRANTPFEGKDSESYSHDNLAQLYPYPDQVPLSQLTDTCLLARLLNKHHPKPEDAYNPPGTEYLPQHYENRPLQYSRYIPAPIPPPYIHDRAVEARRRVIHPQDADIFRNFLTPRPTESKPLSNSTNRVADCPDGTLPCDNGEGCINEKQWCDGHVECSDVSDESRCGCKSRVDKSRICDGYFDCPFGEDEMGCFGCNESAFSCGDVDINSKSTCFTKDERCNNVANCPNHKDEMECTMLASTLLKKPSFAVSNTEGFLHRNFKGDWYAVCKNPYMWAHDACRRETGLIIRPPFIQILPIDPTLQVNYLNTGPENLMTESNSCFNSSAVYVTCPDLLCGTRVLSTSQLLRENAAVENHLFGRNKRFLYKSRPYPVMFYSNRKKRFAKDPNGSSSDQNNFESNEEIIVEMRNKRAESRVVGGRPSQPSAWPWMVAMYRNGMFHCGGVVLTQRWVISAAHCVQKFWEHYYEIQVGMLRRFSFSPQEQNHLVTHVIVNQHYNQQDMRNDLSLLRVKPAIIFSRWIRPICLPGPETAGENWMWGPSPGTICTAVGWGATVEHGPDPDHMREVEVPIWANCKHREDKAGKEICAGLVQGGKDACQGDSGGPLLCRNPLNSQQWYIAGIVSHGDGCARKDEPGVYTRVSLFVKWIKFHVFSKILPTIQPKQECPGFKCLTGIPKCIPNKRVCDKIVDCLNGEDEFNCNSMRTTHTFGDIFLTSPSNKASAVSENLNLNMKEAETELLSTEKPSTTIAKSNTTKKIVNTTTGTVPVAETITTRKAKMEQNESNDSVLKGNPLEHKLDIKRESLEHEHKAIPEIDLTHASTIEISNSRSSEDSNVVSDSDEQVTADPTRSTVTEETQEPNRGDMQKHTMTSSREHLESMSHLSSKNEREADIDEDWVDFDGSLSKGSEFSTVILSPETDNNNHRKHESNKTSSESKHLPETTTVSKTINNEKIKSNLTSDINDNVHLSTLIDNENNEPESKDILVDLLPSSLPPSSADTMAQLHSENTENHEIFDTSKSDTELSTTTVSEFEGKVLDNIKDFAFSKLDLATTKKKHHIPKEFDCRHIYQSVPYYQRCDHKADCEDGTDELSCTCTDYLNTFDKKLICDGIFDCADGQDEIDCYSCPDAHFFCKRSQRCLPLKYVCDGKPQCPQGEDELDCYALSNGKNLQYDFDGRPKVSFEGYLTKKHTHDWHIACEDNLTPDQQEQAAIHICRYLGFSSANRYHVKHINLKEDAILKTSKDDNRARRDINEVPIHFSYRKVEEDSARHIVIKEPQVLKEQCVPNVTKTCMSLYVYCDHSLFNDFDVTQNLLYNRVAEDTAVPTWPWVAKIYAEGDYKCSGVLIDLSWVLVSHSCLWDSLLSHHVTVVLGSHRTLSSTNGMYEQIYKVDAKKDLYHSKVALLHLKDPAQYSNMVKPMVLHSSNLIEENMSTCVAIGQDERNNSVSVYVKETNDNCSFDSRCFLLQNTEAICASGAQFNQQWAGIISCHADEGWYPAASFVDNRGECGIGGRIIASEIGNLKNEIKHYVARPRSNVMEEDDNFDCEGQRCGRGQCVKLTKVCDGVTDCHDGKDESEGACEKKLDICSKKPYHRGCECSSGQMKCRNGKCVAKELFGDGKDDCGDGTDEPAHMSCSHYLARVKPSRLCDGVLHCKDRSDEDPLFCKCFAKQSYKCRSGDVELCVAPDMVCDGVADCPEGDDEHTCIGLTAPLGSMYGSGQVLVRSHGVWHSKCYPTKNHTKSELEAICRELGFISGHAKQLIAPEVPFHSFNDFVTHPFSDVHLNTNTSIEIRNSDEPIAKAIKNESLENCNPVYIECL